MTPNIMSLIFLLILELSALFLYICHMDEKNTQPESTDQKRMETNLALLHLSQLLNNFIPFAGTLIALIVYTSRSHRVALYKQHAAEILNFQITSVVIYAALAVIIGLSIGFGKLANFEALMGGSIAMVTLAGMGLGLFWLVMTVVNAVKGSRLEEANYILVVRILK